MEESIEDMVSRYRNAETDLRNYAKRKFPARTKVLVDCAQYTGPGIARREDGVPADMVSVLLSNGNTWWYPIESVRPAGVEEKK